MGSRFEPIVGITNRGFEVLDSPREKRKDRRAVVVNWLKVTPSSADLFLAFSKIGSSKTSVALTHAYIQMQNHTLKHPSQEFVCSRKAVPRRWGPACAGSTAPVPQQLGSLISPRPQPITDPQD